MDFTRPHIYRRQLIQTGKYYIGKHIGHNQHYKGSGVDWLKDLKELKVNLKTDIIEEILEYVDDVDLINDREEYWLRKLDVANNPLYYNKTNRSRGWTNVTPEQREKLRIAHTGKKQSPEATQKKRDKMLGIPKHTAESRKNIGIKNSIPKPKGFRQNGEYKCTESHKDNLSLSKSKKPIYASNTENNIFTKFRGITQAWKELKIPRNHVKKCLEDGTLYKGWSFKYVN